jgi:hypothetical protein
VDTIVGKTLAYKEMVKVCAPPLRLNFGLTSPNYSRILSLTLSLAESMLIAIMFVNVTLMSIVIKLQQVMNEELQLATESCGKDGS